VESANPSDARVDIEQDCGVVDRELHDAIGVTRAARGYRRRHRGRSTRRRPRARPRALSRHHLASVLDREGVATRAGRCSARRSLAEVLADVREFRSLPAPSADGASGSARATILTPVHEPAARGGGNYE
jgi:hypothetical protein